MTYDDQQGSIGTNDMTVDHAIPSRYFEYIIILDPALSVHSRLQPSDGGAGDRIQFRVIHIRCRADSALLTAARVAHSFSTWQRKLSL